MEHSKEAMQSGWTHQEKWVWERVQGEEEADLGEMGGLDEERVLTSEFLNTILSYKDFRKDITERGVSITGACFRGPIDLSGLVIDHKLMFTDCLFLADVDLTSLKSNDSIFLNGSRFAGKVNMDSIQVEYNLTIKEKTRFDGEVSLVAAKIGNQIDINASTFRKNVNMNRLKAGKYLLISEGSLFEGETSLAFAKIGNHLEISHSGFHGTLNMSNIEVGESLFINNGSIFNDPVDIVSAYVGDVIEVKNSSFARDLNMNNLQVGNNCSLKDNCRFGGTVTMTSAHIMGTLDIDGLSFEENVNLQNLHTWGNLIMRGSTFKGHVDLVSIIVDNSLDISSSRFESLDLTGAKINGRLVLASGKTSPVSWGDESKIILRNARAGVVEDREDAWPEEIQLTSFTYTKLGSSEAIKTNSIAERKISWIEKWLEKEDPYSSQPYEQLSTVLRKMGFKSKANKILFLAKERERKNARGLDWFWLMLQHDFTGYGIYLGYLIVWAFFLVLFGMFFLSFSGQGASQEITNGFYYSFDMLIPLFRLEEHHYKVTLIGLTKYYFYFMKSMGYLLIVILISGIMAKVLKKK